MKNKLILGSIALLGLASGLTSCVTDKEPALQTPTEFVLNTPAYADQLYVFDCDENGKSLTDITLTWSQPNYGVAVTPTYKVELAKSAEDFALYDEMIKNDAELPEGTLPYVAIIDGTTTSAQYTIDGEKFCAAINEIYGFTMENVRDNAVPVSIRVHAEIEYALQSAIYSNIIELKQVLSYMKPVPDQIWLVGEPNSWAISGDPKWILEENEIGSKVYEADFVIPAGKFMFRFYDETGNWDHFSIGSQVEDNPLTIKDAQGQEISKLPEDGITLPCLQESNGVNPKGSWTIPNWDGGKVHIIVDLNNNTVTFTPGQAKKIYIVGAPQGWNISGESMYLSETEDGSDVYTGTYTIAAGDFILRFYSKLGDWDSNSIGSQEEDNPIEIAVTSAPLQVTAVIPGKGSWTDPSWAGGDCKFTVDLKNKTVTFQKL